MITKGERRNRGGSGNRTPSTYRARTRTVGYRKVQDRYSKARKGANQWRFYQKTTLTLRASLLANHGGCGTGMVDKTTPTPHAS